MPERLAISGASGELGRRAAQLALASMAPDRLILVTRAPESLAHLAAAGVTVRRGDFADPVALRGAFVGAKRLLLISATDLDRRVAQHRAAIEAARAAGVEHVIYTSGLAPQPPNPAVVAPSHYETEQALVSSGMARTVLRNSLYADYQIPEATQAIATGALVHNRGSGTAAYVAREDCAAVAAAVLVNGGHEGAVYDVTGPEAFSATGLAALYSKVGGKRVEARSVDDAGFVAGMIGSATGDDHLRYGAELVASFGRSIREGYMRSCTDTVARITGRPATPLREVLAAALRRS